MGVDRKKLDSLIVEKIIKLRMSYEDGRVREQKMTQETLADKLDVPRSTIANIENLRQSVPLWLLFDIAIEFDIELTDLLPSKEELVDPAVNKQDLIVGGKNVQAEYDEELADIVLKAFKGKGDR